MMLVYKLSFKASSWPSCCVPRPFTTADDRHESTRFYAGASDVVSADKTCRHSRNCWRTAMNNYFTWSLTIHNTFSIVYYIHHQQHHNIINLDNERTNYSYHNTLYA